LAKEFQLDENDNNENGFFLKKHLNGKLLKRFFSFLPFSVIFFHFIEKDFVRVVLNNGKSSLWCLRQFASNGWESIFSLTYEKRSRIRDTRT